MTSLTVRPAGPADEAAVARLLDESWSPIQAVGNRLYDLRTLPCLVAVRDGAVVGILHYEIVGSAIEVVSLLAEPRGGGAGTALMEAAATVGTAHGATRLWLVTTNDNLDALRFYQRRGLRMREVRPGGVDAARALKPSIPAVGAYGIEIHDEIVLGHPLPLNVTTGSDNVTA
jgi:ribosomal protein S18 acetylase RimI-like enzyme